MEQDCDGVKHEDYLPNEFQLKLSPTGLKNDQRVQLTYGILKTYQEQMMYEQEAALRRVAEFSLLSPSELVKDNDTWNFPTLLRKNTEAFREQLTFSIREFHEFRDSRLGITFRDIQNDLENRTNTRLEALTALIYRDRLVRDRDLMVKWFQERRQEFETQAQQVAGGAKKLTRLLDTTVGRIPSGHEETVSLATKDLSRIIARYNATIEKYLQATIQSYVTLREGPALAMDGPSIRFLEAGILVLAVIPVFLVVLFERSFRGALGRTDSGGRGAYLPLPLGPPRV